MRKMLKPENVEVIEREVYLWLKKRGFPEENYEKLSPNLKGILHSVVCTAGYVTTHNQRANLWSNLSVPQAMREGRAGLVDSPPDEELRKIFSQLTPAESLPDTYKW